MSKAQENKRKQGYGQAPILRSEQQVTNPRAVAAHHQVNNQQVSRQNRNPRGTRYTTNRTAGGSTQEIYTRYHPKEGVHGVRTHDPSWDRTVNQQKGGTPFKPPTRGGVGRDVQKAQMGAMVGNALDQVRIGDYVEGEFYKGDGFQDRRGAYFGKATNGVLADTGKGTFSVKRVGPTTWLRGDGQVIHFNPKQPMKDLAAMGVKQVARLAGGPAVQGYLTLDQAVEHLTGKRIDQHHVEQNTKSVAAYDKAGVRVPGWGYSTPF